MATIFKRISKALQEEGITLNYLHKVQQLGKMSPVMFKAGDEPVNIVKANKLEYWVLLPDGSYLKDENSQLIKYPLKECVIARARYLLNHKDNEIKAETEKEVERLGKELITATNELVENIKRVKEYASAEPKDTFVVILKNMCPEEYKFKKREAIKYIEAHPDLDEDLKAIELLIKTKDYDTLHLTLEQGYVPAILAISHSDTDGMKLLQKFFSAESINKTVDTLNGQSTIKSIAMFKIQKNYVNL